MRQQGRRHGQDPQLYRVQVKGARSLGLAPQLGGKCAQVSVCQGINSIHAQTARFNNPNFLPLLQTMSSVFSPAGASMFVP